MDVRLRPLTGALIAAFAAFLAPWTSAQGAVGATGSGVEALTWSSDAGLVSVALRTTLPAPKYSCVLPTTMAAELVIEIPGADSRLQNSYPLDGVLLREAHVESGFDKGTGVRVRIGILEGRLKSLAQTEAGIVLTFMRGPAALPGTAPADGEYRVGVGDKIEISVFGHDDLSKVVEVRADGTVNYPLVGDLRVEGKSVAQIDQEITRILGNDYLVDPQVNVDVREYQSQWVTIIGEVKSPGRYVLKRNMQIIDLLAEAGGATKEAGARVLITRHEGAEGGSRQLVVDLGQLLSRNDSGANVSLKAGDIVAIGEKDVFYIRGEVTKPGSYFLDSGMTVLKAITVAGGFTQFANRREVELLRSKNNDMRDRVIVNLKAIEDGKKQDVAIDPNDIIIVPRRVF